MTARPAVNRKSVAMSADDARELTARICQALEGVRLAHELIVKAFRGRAWNALGYTSWDEYCRAEFAGVRCIRLSDDEISITVGALVGEGLSYRAIASATGVSVGKVHKHRPAVAPDNLISLDGARRSRQASSRARHPAGKGLPAEEIPTDYTALSSVEKVVLMVGEWGITGATVRDICGMTGWHHGQASGALSRANSRGLIHASGSFRDGCTVYVTRGNL